MKRVTFTLFGIFILQQVFPQDSEDQMIRNLFDMEKDQIIKYNMNLPPDKGKQFNAIYEEYESIRKSQGMRRIDLMNEYMSQYETLTEDKTAQIAIDMFELQRNFIDLKEKYFHKVSQKLGTKVAARFIQLEEYIHSKVKAQIFEDIRFMKASESY